MSFKKLHGNKAKIDPKNNVEPMYITNVITPNEPQVNNSIPKVTEENVKQAKKDVDENHK